jgi:chromosome segregation ATPase
MPDYDRTIMLDNSIRTDSSKDSSDNDGRELDAIMRDVVGNDAHIDEDEARIHREQQKERMRKRLEMYKLDRGRLRAACAALELALANTSQKLREVDSRHTTRIKALESEVQSQEVCIIELGTKLMRQARVSKKEKDAAEQYKIQLDAMSEAMAEEMAIQTEQNSRKEEDVRQREEEMLAMLRENIEGINELKSEAERDAKNIMELENSLGQKEAMLNKVTRDLGKKTKRICELEQGLKDKTFEVESVIKQLYESNDSVEATRQQLEAATKEIEDMKRKFSGWDTSKMESKTDEEAYAWRRPSKGGDNYNIDKSPILDEAFASELQAKDAATRKLEDACSYALLRFIWDG